VVDVGFAAGNLSVKDTEQNRQYNGFAGASITAHRTYSRWYHRSEGNVFLLIERCSMNLNGDKQMFTDIFHKKLSIKTIITLLIERYTSQNQET
jgi:hypothetical protein